MLNNRKLVHADVLHGMRRGPVIPRSAIEPYLHHARALVIFDAKGPSDATIVRLSRRREGEENETLLDNFFIGAPTTGLQQLRERGPRCANLMPCGRDAIFDAMGLTTPIRAHFGSTGQVEQVAVGFHQSSAPLTLLDPSDTQGLLEGALFHALPLNTRVEDVYAVNNGNALIVRSRDTFDGPVIEYFYGKPGEWIQLKPIKPERNDDHGKPFQWYLDTPEGRFMVFNNASWGVHFQGNEPKATAVRVPVHEYFANGPIVWPDQP